MRTLLFVGFLLIGLCFGIMYRSINIYDGAHASIGSSSGRVLEGANSDVLVRVLVVYAAPKELHPTTFKMAQAATDGAESVLGKGAVRLRSTAEVKFISDVQFWADGVIVGAPVYNANPHPEVLQWLNCWNFSADLSGKVGGAFAVSGGIVSGAESTLLSLLRAMMEFRMIVVGGERWTEAFGASAVTGEAPLGRLDNGSWPLEDTFRSKAEGLGRRVAEVARRLHCSSLSTI